MSQRGKSVFVCLLLVAACAWFQARRSNPAQAATLQGEAAIQELKSGGGYASPAAPPVGKQPCLNLTKRADPARFRAGVRNTAGKKRLDASHLNRVLLSLREKTGWQSLKFDEEGFLVCPDPQAFSGGSEAARRLLGAAILGDAVYDLEVHNGSLAVTFARLAKGIDHEDLCTGAKISTYPVQIDFADFYQLRGDGPALKAFDLGLVILHELAHGVWQLRDAASGDEEPGECETFINQIRRELHLPERQHYSASARLGTANRPQLIAELHFTRALEKQGQARQSKQKRFRLQWEAETVGTITYLSLSQARRRAESRKLVYAR